VQNKRKNLGFNDMTRRMTTLCVLTAALALVAGTPAVAQHVDSDVGRYAIVSDQNILVGHYRLEEGDFSVDVRLNADRTAVYSVAMDKRGGGLRAEGVWDYRRDRIHIHNTAGPVSLDLASTPTVDPAMALSIVATLPDGAPAEGLAVTWPTADGLFYMGDGSYRVPRAEDAVTGAVSIVRTADSKELATFMMKRGAPNSYRFTYHPSDPEPFDIQAAARDARAERLEVEAGSAAVTLKRVRD
jgi:hypothetical protein